ncbi:MAG: hypothetical protein K0R15_1002 [Clostridiales bacterium]|jgi:DNA-binding YbaB/EbfC family protein|nr:hypothetical protein [Clostridiales bacterium]
MSKRGGFPTMPGNMGNLMKQAQKMQKQMEDMQEDLNQKHFECTAGGGAITVVVNGKKEVISITLKEDVVDKDDIEMLQDLIVAAVNEAIRKAEESVSSEMNKITGGLGGSLGGLL